MFSLTSVQHIAAMLSDRPEPQCHRNLLKQKTQVPQKRDKFYGIKLRNGKQHEQTTGNGECVSAHCAQLGSSSSSSRPCTCYLHSLHMLRFSTAFPNDQRCFIPEQHRQMSRARHGVSRVWKDGSCVHRRSWRHWISNINFILLFIHVASFAVWRCNACSRTRWLVVTLSLRLG